MISEIFVGIIALVELLAFMGYVYLTNKEKAKLINALIAKDAQEMIHLTLADQTKIEPEIKTSPELVPADGMSQEQFEEMIDKQNEEELINGSN